MAVKKQSAFKRYLGLISFIGGLIVLFIVFALLTIRAEINLVHQSAKIAMNEQLQQNITGIVRDIYEARVSYGEDPFNPHMRALFSRLNDNISSVDDIFTIMENGGAYTFADGTSAYIEPDEHLEFQQALEQLQANWAPVKARTQEYLAVASDIMIDADDQLKAAELQAQLNNAKILEALDEISLDSRSDFTTTVDRQRLTLIVLMIGVIIYFLALLFIFIRRLFKADEQILEAQQETSEIMQTVQEGLFLIDRDLRVGQQHSTALKEILPNIRLSGQTFEELLESILKKSDIENAKSYINQLFKPKVKEKLVKSLNPLTRVQVFFDENQGAIKEKYLNFDFNRVYENKEIRRILVSVTDETDSVRLEERLEVEKQQNKRQIELLVKVLKIDPKTLESFLYRGEQIMQRINNILKDNRQHGQGLQQKVNQIFREIHGFKGEASALELDHLVDNSEAMESKLKELREKTSLTGDDFLPIAIMLDKTIDQFNMLSDIQARLQLHSSDNLEQLASAALSDDATVNYSNSDINQYLTNYAHKVAQRNHKDIEITVSGFNHISLKKDKLETLKSVAIQLIRNAVVHGIEDSKTRRQNNKNPVGQINVELIEQDNKVELIVKDDGKGIDTVAIKEKLKQLPHFNKDPDAMSTKELFQAIFISGLSTAEQNNEDAGRGVGMDVVKEQVKSIGGALNLRTRKGEFTAFTVNLK